jgi:hypothetical protein
MGFTVFETIDRATITIVSEPATEGIAHSISVPSRWVEIESVFSAKDRLGPKMVGSNFSRGMIMIIYT